MTIIVGLLLMRRDWGAPPHRCLAVGWLAEHFGTRATFRHRGRVPVLAAAATYLYARRFISGRGRDQGATAVQTAAAPHEMVAPRGA